ncbi:aspartate aminotransferase family protein [Candidatus Microgenomates bacterium]|nr:aspartate aminotransferase family protein [Candidatus Microgenomates bacterium]MBI2622324.1 aspartate aminotransferase family protein [Candidatus Microgenomates bacterium]
MNDYLVTSYPNRGVTFVEGKGVYLIEKNGQKYLDFGSNYGVSIFGYQHPAITGALVKQLAKITNIHGSFGSDVRDEAARLLVNRCNSKLSRVFFSSSGSEAIEAALKFTKLATGKTHFVAMEGGYHGKTLGGLSATGSLKYRQQFEPLLWSFVHIPFGDKDALSKSVNKNTAAVILEPVQGEGGVILPPKGYLPFVQKLCNEKGILLIVDEIQTGIGRTGTFLAGEQFGLMPDILCLGKGLAGGIPIGATLVTEEIAQTIPLHVHTSTFGGNPLACAGILAVLREFEDGKMLAHVKETGDYFLSKLKTLKHPKIVAVRGIGLMLAIELSENATPVLKALQQEKIIAIPAGSNIIRFLPPYIIGKKEIDKVISVLRFAI